MREEIGDEEISSQEEFTQENILAYASGIKVPDYVSEYVEGDSIVVGTDIWQKKERGS